MKRLFLIFALALPAFATNYTVKSGGGGNYTTIQACATAMAAGDTCTVFAGTYAENVTVSSGTVGNYKTFTVNGSDTVIVHSFTIGSHVKILGNCPTLQGTITTATCGFFITNPSSPGTSCMSWGSSTDFYIVSNVAYACGTWGSNATESSHPSHGFIQGNSFSYPSSTSAAPNTGPGFSLHGDYFLVENNDISHTSDGFHFSGSYNVFRKNSFHDNLATECGSNSGNCHIDFIESEPNVAGGDVNTLYNVYEGNSDRNCNSSAGCHEFLLQADVCSSQCVDTIVRFNSGTHVLTAGVENDNKWAGVANYNNTEVDVAEGTGGGGGGIADSCSNGATDCQYFNNIYYYPNSITSFNAIGVIGGGILTASHHLAYCAGSPCSLSSFVYGTGTWLGGCATCLLANPVFVGSYSGSGAFDLHLQATSPAIVAGTYLTTVAAGDSGTGTSLVLTDASYFQDNPGSITGVQPDCISITTTTNHICIAGASINHATSTLSLVSGVPRSPGDHVWIYSISDGTVVLNAAGPDMGAFPYTGGGIATTPSCSPGTGTYGSTQTVTCTNSNTGTTVMGYTINGAIPATSGNGTSVPAGTTKYVGPISIPTSATLQVIAGTRTLTDSAVVSYSYLIPILTTYVNGSTGSDAYDCSSATFVSAYVGPCATPLRGSLAGTAGATINIAASKYVLSTALNSTSGSIPAKNNQTFVGPATAIISGGIQLCIGVYTCAGPDGNGNWSVSGMTQQGPQAATSVCNLPLWAGCIYPEDLFVNGVPLQHINSATRPVLTSGTWWFDYTNHIIYFHTNPAGKTVETSVLGTMFQNNGANGLTINGLTVEEFASQYGQGGGIDPAYGGTPNSTAGINWTIENCHVTLNHSNGIRVGFGMKILNCVVTANGNLGIGGGLPATAAIIPSGLVIQGDTVTGNNYAEFNPGTQGGGIKLGNTWGAILRGLTVSSNLGHGIHFDGASGNELIDSNTVNSNEDPISQSGLGIECEIGFSNGPPFYGCTIRNNVTKYNGEGATGGPNPQIQSSTSQGMQAYCNVIETDNSSTHMQGLQVTAANRGTNNQSPFLNSQFTSTGNYFHHNTEIWDTGSTANVGFMQTDAANQPNFWTLNTPPDFNTYHASSTSQSTFLYNNNSGGNNTVTMNFSTYQASTGSPDAHGTIDTHYNVGFPIVTITSPADQSTVPSPTTITATASDGSGIASVKFYVDWTLAATVSSAPYTYAWPGSGGSHVIAAMALANSGVQACNAVSVTGTGGTKHQVTITENILTTSDALSRSAAYKQGLSETLSTSASLSVAFAGNISLAEDLTTTDVLAALVFGATVSLSDSVTTSDALARLPIYKQALSDSLSTSDSMTTSSAANVTISEALTTSDAMAVTGNFVLALSETLTTSDVLLQQNTFQVLSDSLTTSEILVAVHGSQTVVPGSPSNLLGTVH